MKTVYLSIIDFFKLHLRLAHKFILLTALLLLISFTCLYLYFISFQNELLFSDIHELTGTLGRNLASNAAFGIITRDQEQLDTLINSLGQCKDIVYAWLEDKQGAKLASYSNLNLEGVTPKFLDKISLFSSSVIAEKFKTTSYLMENEIFQLYRPNHGPEIIFSCHPVIKDLFKSKDELVIGLSGPQIKKEVIGSSCIGFSLKRVHDNARKASLRSLLIVFVIALLAIFLSYYAANWISSPLIKLRDAADKMSEGILPSAVDVRSGDEIGELAVSFNKMATQILGGKKALENAFKELENVNHSLEDQVASRTEELKKNVFELTEAGDRLQNAYAEMKNMHDSKSGFLRTASHELRTPLTAIKANIDYLLMYEHQTMGEEATEILQIVCRNINNMKRLVEEMLTVVRLDYGNVNLEFRENFLYEIVSECEYELRSLRTGKLIINIDKGLTLYSDRSKIHDLFINLIRNAYKFTPPNGLITVSAQKESKAVQITVADTGAGIENKHLKNIFEPFYQAESGKGGTGLGLAIVKGIVERHGGNIEVKSEPGKGTSFTFYIPARSGS